MTTPSRGSKKIKWTEEKVKEFNEYDLSSSYGDSNFQNFAKGKKIIDIIPVQRPQLFYLVRYREPKLSGQIKK